MKEKKGRKSVEKILNFPSCFGQLVVASGFKKTSFLLFGSPRLTRYLLLEALSSIRHHCFWFRMNRNSSPVRADHGIVEVSLMREVSFVCFSLYWCCTNLSYITIAPCFNSWWGRLFGICVRCRSTQITISSKESSIKSGVNGISDPYSITTSYTYE